MSKPYWSALRDGMLSSRSVTEMALDPVSGNIFVGTSESRAQPKYCRRSPRTTSFVPILLADLRTITVVVYSRPRTRCCLRRRQVRVVFHLRLHRVMGCTRSTTGGLKVDPQVSGAAPLWQVNTVITVSRWDSVVTPPQELGRYRVGLLVNVQVMTVRFGWV